MSVIVVGTGEESDLGAVATANHVDGMDIHDTTKTNPPILFTSIYQTPAISAKPANDSPSTKDELAVVDTPSHHNTDTIVTLPRRPDPLFRTMAPKSRSCEHTEVAADVKQR